ncbi:MAG TPA: hypothetical protein PLO61_08255 [Fimbriimonadaceae bacterium]|nr:hypothetical protein [Fimbriimonadaceae bacterium]HRJ33463.1 hypothetical protein [Fimbriimonadaceae bacterium]
MKKALLIGLPVLLIGAVIGLGVLGIVPIPGLSPKKKPGANLYAANKMYGEAKEALPEKPKAIARAAPPKPKPAPPVKEKPQPDPVRGAKRLAKLWNPMQPSEVVAITKDWRESDLALVLSQMESEAASAILAALEPARASRLSREIQRLAAQPPAETN